MERLAKGPGRLGTCGSHALNSNMDHAVLDNSGSTQMRKKISAMNILPGETRDTWENKERYTHRQNQATGLQPCRALVGQEEDAVLVREGACDTRETRHDAPAHHCV